MQLDEVHYGQRVRVNVPGLGDHGQLGTVKKVRGTRCYVRLDWDQRVQHPVWFYAQDLDAVPADAVPAPSWTATSGWAVGHHQQAPAGAATRQHATLEQAGAQRTDHHGT